MAYNKFRNSFRLNSKRIDLTELKISNSIQFITIKICSKSITADKSKSKPSSRQTHILTTEAKLINFRRSKGY